MRSRFARVAWTGPWDSNARTPNQMAVGEYHTSTSVESSAGRPSTGEYSENPVRAAACAQTSSESRPSTTTPASARRGTVTSVPPAAPEYGPDPARKIGTNTCRNTRPNLPHLRFRRVTRRPAAWVCSLNLSRPGCPMIPFGQYPVARRPALLLFTLSFALGTTAAAQIIPIRSVPLAQGDQFLIFPSTSLGMAGVSLALADSLLDPFRNPAMGARVAAGRLFAAPTVYGISRETGGGRTLPLGLLGRAGPWFGGLSGAIQQVEYSGPMPSIAFPIGIDRVQSTSILPNPVGLSGRSHGNSYLQASLGRVLTGSGLSVGGGVLWSRLRAVSGVDLLYPGSQGLAQKGHQLDLRLGLLKE